jgi:hypothetical protein
MTVVAALSANEPLAAPMRLMADTRLAFRREADEHLEVLARREAGMGTRIRGARDGVRAAIEGMRLHHLFDFVESSQRYRPRVRTANLGRCEPVIDDAL